MTLPAPRPRRPARDAPVLLRWQIWLPWAALAAILLTATRTDPDLWGHVRFGLDWLDTLRLPSTDPYSFTQDRPWVNHEWLSEALMALWFDLAGPPGLVLLKTIVMAAAVAVVWRRLRGASPIVRAGITTLAIAGALPLSGTIRPQVWSVLGLALLIPLLDDPPPTRRRGLAAAALFALWANLHGGWITGGAALATHIVIRTVVQPAEWRRWWALGAASLAATLLNPYGIGLWRFLAATVRSTRPDVTEWAPFSLQEPAIMWVSIVAPLAGWAFLFRRRETRPSPEVTGVLFVLLLAGLRVSRVAPLVCPAAFALLGPGLAAALTRVGWLTAPSPPAAGVLLVPAVLSLAIAAAPVARAFACLPISDAWAPDRAAAAQLQGRSGRLWTTFDWGEYAIWHFGPALQVSIDGRRETVYSSAIVEWHRAVEQADEEAIDRMTALAPDYVWLPASRSATRAALERRGYRVDVETADSFIAVRRGVPPISGGGSALPECFP